MARQERAGTAGRFHRSYTRSSKDGRREVVKAEPRVVWEPQPRQARALSSDVDELFYGGAAGGGKSDFLLADYLSGVQYGSDHRGILFRRSYPELEELILRSHELYRPLGATWNKQERQWTFPTGATLKMRFLSTDMDVYNYQGHQYTWVGWDELTNWASDFCYVYMISRNRSAAGVPCYIRSAGNPGGVGHAWVKRRFIDVCASETIFYDEETERTRVFIPAKLEDNQILVKNDPGYEKRLDMFRST